MNRINERTVTELYNDWKSRFQMNAKRSEARAAELAAAKVCNLIDAAIKPIEAKVKGDPDALTEAEIDLYDDLYCGSFKPFTFLIELSGTRTLALDREEAACAAQSPENRVFDTGKPVLQWRLTVRQ